MADVVCYWAVGETEQQPLNLSLADVSRHLVEDWLPSLPPSLSTSIVGWPPFVLEPLDVGADRYWMLGSRARQTERQWKMVVSWMLGIVGTRQVLATEGYTWVAPASAFYADRRVEVEVPQAPPDFFPSSLSISQDPQNPSILRPDYVCLRRPAGGGPHEITLAESKGCARALQNASECPPDWYDQVRNAIVEYAGPPGCDVARHLVVATRVNPNASRESFRRLQVRAWNRREETAAPPPELLIEVASAQYAGVLRNLDLKNSVGALQLAARRRRAAHLGRLPIHETSEPELRREAERELSGLLSDSPASSSQTTAGQRIKTEHAVITVTLHELCGEILRMIQSETPAPEQVAAIERAEAELDRWYEAEHGATLADPGLSLSRSGLVLRYEPHRGGVSSIGAAGGGLAGEGAWRPGL